MELVALSKPTENRNSVGHGRLVHEHLLETPLQRRVLLDVLTELVKGGGSNATQLTTSKHRLEQISSVHRPLSLAGADDRMNFVNEEHHLPLTILHLLDHGLETLLELTPILSPGNQRADVERYERAPLQRGRDVTRHDPLGQALRHRRLPHARLADKHRVILRTTRQDLDTAAHFVVAADDWVQLAIHGRLREITAILAQRLILALRILILHVAPASNLHDHFLELGRRHALLLEECLSEPLVVNHGDHQLLHADVLVSPLRLEPLCLRYQLLQRSPQNLLILTADFRRSLDERVSLLQNPGGVEPGLGQDAARQTIRLLQQRLEKVLRLDNLMRVGTSNLRRSDDRLPCLLRIVALGYALPRGGVGAERPKSVCRRGRPHEAFHAPPAESLPPHRANRANRANRVNRVNRAGPRGPRPSGDVDVLGGGQ
mmetsp:Transcript_11213/g.31353  ORF Transcript_11213/g.31353 Transcript_11213/m.31353 type:complete len:431 (+) Transcript_11213:1614-2906(+)